MGRRVGGKVESNWSQGGGGRGVADVHRREVDGYATGSAHESVSKLLVTVMLATSARSVSS